MIASRSSARGSHRSSPKGLIAGALVVAVALTAACQGGPSDVPGGGRGGDADTTLTLVAYAVPEPGFREIIPAFNATEAGKGIQITQSYGASGDQSRGVEGGKPADIVNFSVEPDITRLVKAKKVSADWDKDAFGGIPFGSVVTLVVRKGNPKHVKDWDDLLQPGLEVISPSPLSSGSAKWNLLAPYAAKSEGGKNPQAGLDFVSKLVREHVKMRPGSGREATEVFVQGSGDVLISYENEAIFTESLGKPIEHVNVPITFKIENPVAVVSESLHVKKATEFKNFLYTPEAQRIWAKTGFRPVDPGVAAEFASSFPVPSKLWTIKDLGGWKSVDKELFDKNDGSITKIYKEATG
ncbi:Probable sulfate ABC transporter, sulfate-binding protein SubI [Mycobacteroides abscessus subsp. bolletii]|uniref:Probable sulfate ABC transporter, sulfate-binding protein SubI n=1 Tax=Mycobacteroides abscessus subsp. bolletii TaxID=319705 RepID=A0A9Q7SCY8_9MYCO|nr:sulfate ABC transporter substrate-binding protein [Mycobacteroides abscessus]EHM21634.1 sulfate ABC transporter, sulfate-binding protein SubI [Mycobacteroides abscessus subsp. bolletii BD]MBN7303773.1 sulfate ABC transporter substrate-binding protein [Mycobacteroides abscessus subsp. bolletii]MBN7322473.1 sulfate ABC transporter substrate-binding protein [Mycobacteroides abscessus subsp. massiliense]MDM2495307.1 sulfate ABC transporter substrate-binding protein [Mycobacteroides abscessus]MD